MAQVEWDRVCDILDFVNLMSYDFFGGWDSTTNHNAPLYAPAQGDPEFNLHRTVTRLLLDHHVPLEKLNAGVAFYGRSAKTVGTPGLHVLSTGQPDLATFPEDEGTPLYYNTLLKMQLFTQHFDDLARSLF